MTTLLLIRHGENDFIGKRLAGRLPDVHLNIVGNKHAYELAGLLCEAPLSAIYSSPLERTMETAAPLAASQKLPIQLHAGLQEVDFGEWTGITIKQMRRRKLFKQVQSAPSQVRFPGGESYPEAQARMVAALDEIVQRHADQQLVACFSHSDSIKLAIAHYLGLGLDGFQAITISPCSVSAVYVPLSGRATLVHLNQVARLSFPKPAHNQ
jgi:probable phosphoglycerate mutase